MTDAADGVETISRTCELGACDVSAANLDIFQDPGRNMGGTCVGISANPSVFFLTSWAEPFSLL